MHIGLVGPESASHLDTASSVGLALMRRGHEVTYFGLLDAAHVTAQRGIRFVPLAPELYPEGSVRAALAPVRESSGLRSALHTMALFRKLAALRLRALPELLRRAGIEGLVADQLAPEAATVAQELGIRFVNIASAVPINQDLSVPPFFTPWQPSLSPLGLLRNRAGYAFFDRVNARVRAVVNERRRELGFAPLSGPGAGLSSLLQLSQFPEQLDFAYRTLPRHVHRVGPLQDHDIAQEGAWSDDLRNGQPLVYVSFGTVNNGVRWLYQRVLDALASEPVQVCLSLGGASVAEAGLDVPRGALVLSRVPQRSVLGRAAVFITHAGVSSSLEGLLAGVPMLAIPLANDQPGMAARLQYRGAARLLLPRHATLERIRTHTLSLLHDADYRARAVTLGDALRAAPGLPRAAQLIEEALASGRVHAAPST
jgi:zeaxanthin glucosyltransferase